MPNLDYQAAMQKKADLHVMITWNLIYLTCINM